MSKNYLQAAVEIAQQAGKILIEEFSRPLDIRYKGDEVDLVTQADKRSEQFIVSRLNEYFPGHAITAEGALGRAPPPKFRCTAVRSAGPPISPLPIPVSAVPSPL